MPDIFTEIERSELGRWSVIEYLSSGKILVIRQAPELLIYRDLLVEETARLSGGARRAEIEALFHEKEVPSDEAIADISHAFSRLSRAYLLTVLFAQLYLDTKLPQPNLADYGGLRLVVPPAVFERMRRRTDLFTREDWDGPQNPPDPGWYGVLMTQPARIHRDIGGPHFTFQANYWCALQDLSEHETLIFFPEAYRDSRPDDYYLSLRGHDPREWGYGRPASIAMRAGDILLFHGEHYHASPVYSEKTVRISQDIRLVGCGFDDNGWYRGGFLNLRNFLPADTAGAQIETAKVARHLLHTLENAPSSPPNWAADNLDRAIGLQSILWLRNRRDLPLDYVEAMTEAMRQLPFAEDRFVEPYLLAEANEQGDELCKSIECLVIDQTLSYFWACIFGGLALQAGRTALADRAFNRAKSAARSARKTLDCSRNPINYFAANAQRGSKRAPFVSAMTPDDVDEVIQLYRSGAMSCIGSKPRAMFRPYYPYVIGTPTDAPRKSGFLSGVLALARNKPPFPPRRLSINPTFPAS